MWDEAVRAIPKMWTQDTFSWEGKYFSMPERAIIPKPVQKPHPPLWVAVSSSRDRHPGGRARHRLLGRVHRYTPGVPEARAGLPAGHQELRPGW